MKYLTRFISVILSGLFTFTISSCDNEQRLKMTIVLHDNQNPGEKVTTDTLVLDSIIAPGKSTIDIYFCSNQFQIPYYLPTAGIYKDSIKEMECDLSKYPQNVKCYKYDEKNRVVSMSVNGSGTMGDWNYKYDAKDRITHIEWLGHNYRVKYNESGLLTDLTEESGSLKRRLQIMYK